MTSKETEKVMKLLVTCRKAFPHSKADAETLTLYVRLLESLSYAEIEAAVFKTMRTCKFFPTVAEILEAAQSVKGEATETDIPTAGEAWKEAMDNVRKNHLYKQWTYSTPEVKQAVEQFGKMELIALEEDAMNTARAQFMRIYNAVVEKRKDRRVNRETLNALPKGHVNMLVGDLTGKLSVLPGGKKEAGA